MEKGTNSQGRKWIGVTFDCCKQYGRAYLNEKKQEYLARCPKCLRTLKFVVGDNGVSDRFFQAD